MHLQTGWVGRWQLPRATAEHIRDVVLDHWRHPAGPSDPDVVDRHLAFGEAFVADTWFPLTAVVAVQIFPVEPDGAAAEQEVTP